MTLALTSLFYVPIVFVHVRHITCSSYTLMPAPVLFDDCSEMCNPPLISRRALSRVACVTAFRYLDAVWCSSGCGSSSASRVLRLA
jgi:hypothetical protein